MFCRITLSHKVGVSRQKKLKMMYKENGVIYIQVTNQFFYDVDLNIKTKEDWLSFLREKNWWSSDKEITFNRLCST